MTNATRFLFTRKTWCLVFAALLMVTIHAPARADSPCSGGDDNFARPIAAILQPNASAYNPNGRFEVAMKSNADLTTDITIGHSLGDRKLFRAITRLKTSNPSSAVVGQLPVSEGLGFSIRVAEGGSGYTEICTYGFRFQQGIVSYRLLAARAETRDGGVHAGDVTAWNSVSEPTASITQPHSFDGTYYQESYRFGFSVTGNQGFATVSNSPTYKPGDVMLSFTPSSPKTFSGQQLCTDGKFHPVTGTLADDGSIDMVIQGCFPRRYKMVRQGNPTPAPGSQSPLAIFGGSALPSPPSNMAGTTPAVAPVLPLPKLTEPELTKVASAYEYALLAEAVYSGRTPITLDTRAGTIRWQQSDRQIQTFPGTNFGLGFKASTYWRRDSVSRKVVCAVVFAGTDFPDPVDWANNIRQAEGSLAAEYEQGAMYAAKVSSGACRTASKIVLVGHSLGGGIAQYAFAKTGGIHETWTFNSAGLYWMKTLELMPYIGSARVSNLIAQAYDATDGKKLIGHEPASVTGMLLTTPIRVPVYGFRLPHLIDVISEGIGIQRDYCLAAGDC